MEKQKFELTSFHLHIIAMALMLCDHLWATVVPGNDWLTAIGRMTFPLFAFMTVEGFFLTKNLKKYVKRLFVFALVSEVPFNLIMSGSPFYPFHQNVLWTFLIGISMIYLNEKVKDKKLIIRILTGAGTVALGAIFGTISFADYYYAGVLTVLVFYFFRGRKLYCFLGQLACLSFINFEMLGGLNYVFEFYGTEILFPQQGIAVAAIIPIWLYRGKQGFYNKTVKNIYYWFYPAHMLLLWAAGAIMNFLE